MSCWSCIICGLHDLPDNLVSCLCGGQKIENKTITNTSKNNSFRLVFHCKDLLNKIKDFGGILVELSLYFITRFVPRKWGYQWCCLGR